MITARRKLLSRAIAVLAGALATPSVHAFDLTGHWVGTERCRGGQQMSGHVAGASAAIMDISQSGSDLNATQGTAPAAGLVFDDPGNPNRTWGSMVFCGTDDDYPLGTEKSLTHLEAVLTSTKAKMKTRRVVFTRVNASTGLALECRGTFERTSPSIPPVGACP